MFSASRKWDALITWTRKQEAFKGINLKILALYGLFVSAYPINFPLCVQLPNGLTEPVPVILPPSSCQSRKLKHHKSDPPPLPPKKKKREIAAKFIRLFFSKKLKICVRLDDLLRSLPFQIIFWLSDPNHLGVLSFPFLLVLLYPFPAGTGKSPSSFLLSMLV